jgi:chromosome partitioning protein
MPRLRRLNLTSHLYLVNKVSLNCYNELSDHARKFEIEMESHKLRIGQVSSMLGIQLTGSDLNIILGRDRESPSYHNKYSLRDMFLARNHYLPRKARSRPVIISSYACRTGSGKTTVIANLGCALAFMGYRVLLIDADEQSDLSVLFGIGDYDSNVHIGKLLEHPNLPIHEFLHPIYPDGMLEIIPSSLGLCSTSPRLSADANRRPTLFSEFVERHKDFLASKYDFILIDPSAYATQLTFNLLSNVDELLGVVWVSKLALYNATKIMENVEVIAKGFGVDIPTPTIISNGYAASIKGGKDILVQLSNTFRGNLCDVVIPEYMGYPRRVARDKVYGTIIEREPLSYTSASFFDLARVLSSKHLSA